MVIPSIPASSRASLTASSLEGWRTASIFSMSNLPRLTAYQAGPPRGLSLAQVFPSRIAIRRRPKWLLRHGPVDVEVVAFFAVLRQVEAGHFVLWRDPQSD